ncbi:molybdopterin-dependent oxidoreductase [Salicibibacter cibi]|uniref:Molybdopterin-dependent oxidoreductase n=1 Tax=Salicibibacter cibi TaxID=2743001 RepID=A0A7T6ZCL3_9BACI|nr:molybdopterin cofactor-binding domain-containing protein [Salicibibacter cibi]QQK81045.1 molybdopterin-dependent oxidoreductase [Salicibibacter cibi]
MNRIAEHKNDTKNRYHWIGKRVPRIDGPEKVTGKLQYMTDRHYPDMVWGKVLRSKYPHAQITNIDTTQAEALPGVICILTYEDIPGFNGFGIVTPDQPVLCEDVVRCTADAVALVAAETNEIAEEALRLIQVDYHPLGVVDDAEYAMTEQAPPLHPDGNIHGHFKIQNGDINHAFEEADYIFENTYYSPRQMHAFIETEGGWGKLEEDGTLTIQCPAQYAYRDRLQISRALGINPESIHVISSPNGGGFGGKDEITVQIYLALLALHSGGRPVKIHLNREESVQASLKRHPFKVHVKTGVNKDGRIIANQVRAVADTGAYASLGPAVTSLAVEHACGPYTIPNVDIEGFCVYTNNGIAGAFRGFGVNQVCVGIETHIDMTAEKIGMDPIEIRKKNAYRQGDISSVGHVVKSSVGTHQTLYKAQHCDLWVNRETYKKQTTEPWKKRGVAVATSFHGVGMGIDTPDYGAASIELLPDGHMKVAVGCEEIGTGNGTVYAQVCAELLHCDISHISVVQGDTAETLDGGTISASRSTYTGTRAIATVAPQMIQRLIEAAGHILDVPTKNMEIENGSIINKNNQSILLSFRQIYDYLVKNQISTTVQGHFYLPKEKNEIQGSGGAPHHIYGYLTHVVMVEVDTLTGETDVLRVVSIPDCGKVMNLQGLEGQAEGGAVMGIGYTLFEDVIIEDGHNKTNNLSDYIIPTILETPEIETIPVEDPEPSNPFGAKGIGEVVMIPIIPAIMSAIYDATGAKVRHLPATPERIYEAMKPIQMSSG